jgi:hypothetical protein
MTEILLKVALITMTLTHLLKTKKKHDSFNMSKNRYSDIC